MPAIPAPTKQTSALALTQAETGFYASFAGNDLTGLARPVSRTGFPYAKLGPFRYANV